MPIHTPGPTQPTDRCPKCGTQGAAQQQVGPMKTYACPKCGTKWVAPA